VVAGGFLQGDAAAAAAAVAARTGRGRRGGQAHRHDIVHQARRPLPGGQPPAHACIAVQRVAHEKRLHPIAAPPSSAPVAAYKGLCMRIGGRWMGLRKRTWVGGSAHASVCAWWWAMCTHTSRTRATKKRMMAKVMKKASTVGIQLCGDSAICAPYVYMPSAHRPATDTVQTYRIMCATRSAHPSDQSQTRRAVPT
jgi:hypothetical protein